MALLQQKALQIFMAVLLITSILILTQIFILGQKVSDIHAGIENTDMSFDLVYRFFRKCDPLLLQEISEAYKKNVDKVFLISIRFSHELSASEIEEMKSFGMSFLRLNKAVIHEEEIYSTCGSLRALIEAASRDEVIEINSMLDDIMSSGTYYVGAFANVSEYAEVTVNPPDLTVGQWATISIRNTHSTKKMAFTLIVYQELEDGLQVEIFSTAKPMQDMDDQPYLFLDPNSTFEVDLLAENAGRFFVTPKMVFFIVNHG